MVCQPLGSVDHIFNGAILPINVCVLSTHLALDYLEICLLKSEVHLYDNVNTNRMYLLSNLPQASNCEGKEV